MIDIMDSGILFTFSIFIAYGSAYSNAASWSYHGETGPEFWSILDGGALCNGTSQSPIDIVIDSAVKQEYDPWKLVGYDSEDPKGAHPTQIVNNGHGVQVNLEGDYLVSGGGLPSTYRAVQFHLHWGSDSSKGSEHNKDGKAYPAELHIVHFDTLNYLFATDAITQKDGLAVLGFFVEVGDHHPGWNPIISALAQVKYVGTYDLMTPFQVSALIPSDLSRFYRYRGSLTTPGCYESVVWTMFEETIAMSNEQIAALRALSELTEAPTNGEDKPIVDNYRPVQPLNGRTLYAGYTSELIGEDAKNTWSYHGETGPEFWSILDGGELCNGTSQSPVDIVTGSAVKQEYDPWKLVGYDNEDPQGAHPTQIVNNGHGVQVNLEGDYLVSGGGLPSIYRAVQFHLHWGSDSSKGSEHNKDGKTYPAELHIVHFDTLNYLFATDAITQKDGLAVLGFFVEVGDHSPAWDPIISALAEVKYIGTFDLMTPFQVSALIPSDLSRFYRYRGSLTTPGCYESVVWTLFEETIKMSKEQIAALRTLSEVTQAQTKFGEDDEPIVDNYRPVQPLNGRILYAGYTSEQIRSAIDISCANSCNKKPDESMPCQCDALCRQRGDCCKDYSDHCMRLVCSYVPTFKNKMRKQKIAKIDDTTPPTIIKR